MWTNLGRVRVLGAMLVIAASFALGYFTAELRGSHPQVLIGSGYAGGDVASLQVGDTWYGFRSSVSWTDSQGALHDNGWPDCLPHLQEVTGIRFAAETRWVGGFGTSRVVWVDCRPD